MYDLDLPRLYSDFYTLSTFEGREDSFLYKELTHEVYQKTKQELLRDVALCIGMEIKHVDILLEHIDDREKWDGPDETERRRWDARHTLKDLRPPQILKEDPLQIKLCRDVFLLERWPESFGGDAWADICKAWLDLYHSSSQNLIVSIDRLIDLSHNTGNVLNKLYPNVDLWLTIKTETTNPYWIFNQSRHSRLAKRLAKKHFNFHEEDFTSNEIAYN